MERHGITMILARAMCCRLGTALHELLATMGLEQWVGTPRAANTSQPKQSHISLIVPSGTGQAPEHPYSIHLHQANVALGHVKPLAPRVRLFPWHDVSQQQLPDISNAQLSLHVPAPLLQELLLQ